MAAEALMRTPTHKQGLGSLRAGSEPEISVIYELKIFQKSASVQEIVGKLHPDDDPCNFAELMGKELTLTLQEGGKLTLFLADEAGNFKTHDPIVMT
jgi:hypothetical protein